MKIRHLATFAALGLASAAHALTFDLTYIPGTSDAAKASFAAAASWWSSRITDPVTVKLTVGTGDLPAGVLAQAQSRLFGVSYSSARGALVADSSTAADATAVAHLPAGDSVNLMLNWTTDNPNGSGSGTPYLDANGSGNNKHVYFTAANALALGYALPSGGVAGCLVDCDGFIQFGTGWTWDHNRSDGIAVDAFDFVGIAAHEIGHSLGFVSGADYVDYSSPLGPGDPAASDSFWASILDLYRRSDASAAVGAIDLTADARDKFFTIDGGATRGPLFSTGRYNGDGRQASHWKDGLDLGIMDPTAAKGEMLDIDANDLLAMDVIGWNAAAIPEPSTYALMLAGLAALGGLARRRRG